MLGGIDYLPVQRDIAANPVVAAHTRNNGDPAFRRAIRRVTPAGSSNAGSSNTAPVSLSGHKQNVEKQGTQIQHKGDHKADFTEHNFPKQTAGR